MDADHERVVDYTTPNFNGIISMMDPSRSWVAREPRIRRFVPGCYTLAVAEALPEDLQNLCKASKATLEQAAGGETPLSSPERQATTAMPLRISRTPLQLGTIPSGNFHPHAHIPVHITIPISHPPTSPIPPTPCLFLLYHSPSSLVQSTYSSLPSPSSAWSSAVS